MNADNRGRCGFDQRGGAQSVGCSVTILAYSAKRVSEDCVRHIIRRGKELCGVRAKTEEQGSELDVVYIPARMRPPIVVAFQEGDGVNHLVDPVRLGEEMLN